MPGPAPQLVVVEPDAKRRARLGDLIRVAAPRCAARLTLRLDRLDTDGGVLLVVIPAGTEPLSGGVAAARRLHPGAGVLVVGTDAAQAEAIAALRAGADDFVPPDDAALIERIVHHLRRDRPRPVRAAGTLYGESPAMRQVRDAIAGIACSDAAVVVTGETGTGKELVAQAIHRASRRAGAPLIAVNCAAVPDTLIESELFGHARGAFTGADRAHPGKIGLADRGTLLLDEVGELSPAGQAKILRALECREMWPLGGRAAVPFDVRVIAATNRALAGPAADGQFRPDLFYRLAVARVHIPPLRERREDIEPTARQLLARLEPAAELSPMAVERLAEYDWPGNVRELRNALEVALIAVPEGRILAHHLPDWVGRAAGPVRVFGKDDRAALVAALAQAGGNKSRAAQVLACSRMTLYRRLVRHGLAAPP